MRRGEVRGSEGKGGEGKGASWEGDGLYEMTSFQAFLRNAK